MPIDDHEKIRWEDIKDLKPSARLTMARNFNVIMPEPNEIDIKLSNAEKLTRARAAIAAQENQDNKD